MDELSHYSKTTVDLNSVCLIPYCPLPSNTGARNILNKHLNLLNSLGKCTILSRLNRPVGSGWGPNYQKQLIDTGYELSFQRNSYSIFPLIRTCYSIGYALLFKILRCEGAFGHSNPYHRYAFDPEWFYDQTVNKDLCEIHYSYWARLNTACPKVVIIHDLWSDLMWEGSNRETEELKNADLLVTVSYDDKVKLDTRGLRNVHWSPPCILETISSDSLNVGLVGSNNKHNIEGLRWLKRGLRNDSSFMIHCFGDICDHVTNDRRFVAHGRYEDAADPYKKCGIILMLTKHGTGLQIKGVEALAAGRAIIARKGAMRGLPDSEGSWLEFDTAEELIASAKQLVRDKTIRGKLAQRARSYYAKYLNSSTVLRLLKEKYLSL